MLPGKESLLFSLPSVTSEVEKGQPPPSWLTSPSSSLGLFSCIRICQVTPRLLDGRPREAPYPHPSLSPFSRPLDRRSQRREAEPQTDTKPGRIRTSLTLNIFYFDKSGRFLAHTSQGERTCFVPRGLRKVPHVWVSESRLYELFFRLDTVWTSETWESVESDGSEDTIVFHDGMRF